MRDYIIDIVQRYVDQRIRKSGDQNVTCRCPFHKGGQEATPSFSVNVEIGLFNCFTCHESGTIPQLLTMLGLPPEAVDREVGPFRDLLKANIQELRRKRQAQFFSSNPYRSPYILSEAFISGFDWCPTQLVEMGFQWQWLKYLQVGVDRRNQRITYPVRDIYGNLAGFIGGRTNAGQLPKYKVYKGKQVLSNGSVIPSDYGPWFDDEYPGYDFQNHNYLWNYDRVYPRLFFGKEVETIIIVEGFKACLWLIQHGWRNTVALMGSSMSSRQLELIRRVNARILLFLDNNAAGQEGAFKIGSQLQKAVPTVWAVNYPHDVDEECQPDDLDYSRLRQVIGSAPLFRDWKKERNYKWV